LNCFTELHYVHTELHNVLLCETLCYLCVTPCNSLVDSFENFAFV